MLEQTGTAVFQSPGEHLWRPTQLVTVLSVSPFEEDHRCLRSIFDHSNWTLESSFACGEAVDFRRRNPTPVIISEKELAGHCWRYMLEEIGQLTNRPRPRLVVASRLADDQLWSEVLNLGGYNVLEKPFDRNEVFWVISHAWLDWKSELQRQQLASSAAGA